MNGRITGLLGWMVILPGWMACNADTAELSARRAMDSGFATDAAIVDDGGLPDAATPDSGPACTPLSCEVSVACGMIDDGCGGIVDCGSCAVPQSCGGGGTNNMCGGCAPCEVQVLVGRPENHHRNNARGIAVDATHVYWANFSGYEVERIEKEGGLIETLATEQTQAFGLVLDATHVYWTTYFGVQRMSKAGGPIESLSGAEQQNSHGIVLDETHVYWSQTDGEIQRTPKGGGPIETLANESGSAKLALDATHVYWANWQSGSVRRVAKDGGDVETYVTGQPGSSSIVVDDTYVYWTNYPRGQVQRAPKVGGNVDVLVDGPDEGAIGIVMDDTHLYWSNFRGVQRISKSGGDVERIADRRGGPWELALDGPYIYLSGQSGDRILRVPACCRP